MNRSDIFLSSFFGMICAVYVLRVIGEIEKQIPLAAMLMMGILLIGTLVLLLWKEKDKEEGGIYE